MLQAASDRELRESDGQNSGRVNVLFLQREKVQRYLPSHVIKRSSKEITENDLCRCESATRETSLTQSDLLILRLSLPLLKHQNPTILKTDLNIAEGVHIGPRSSAKGPQAEYLVLRFILMKSPYSKLFWTQTYSLKAFGGLGRGSHMTLLSLFFFSTYSSIHC